MPRRASTGSPTASSWRGSRRRATRWIARACRSWRFRRRHRSRGWPRLRPRPGPRSRRKSSPASQRRRAQSLGPQLTRRPDAASSFYRRTGVQELLISCPPVFETMDIDSLKQLFADDLANAGSEADLRALRDKYLSRKNGLISAFLKAVAAAPVDDRPALGQAANQLKRHIDL